MIAEEGLCSWKRRKNILNMRVVKKVFFFQILPFSSQSWLLWFFSHSVMSDSLQSHGLQHTRVPCPSPSPGVCSNSCPLSWWCLPTISSSFVPFSSCLQSFPASGFFQWVSFSYQVAKGAWASVLPLNIQGWFPLGLDFPCGSAGKESTCSRGDLGLIPEFGRSPGKGKGYPL